MVCPLLLMLDFLAVCGLYGHFIELKLFDCTAFMRKLIRYSSGFSLTLNFNYIRLKRAHCTPHRHSAFHHAMRLVVSQRELYDDCLTCDTDFTSLLAHVRAVLCRCGQVWFHRLRHELSILVQIWQSSATRLFVAFSATAFVQAGKGGTENRTVWHWEPGSILWCMCV